MPHYSFQLRRTTCDDGDEKWSVFVDQRLYSGPLGLYITDDEVLDECHCEPANEDVAHDVAVRRMERFVRLAQLVLNELRSRHHTKAGESSGYGLRTNTTEWNTDDLAEDQR